MTPLQAAIVTAVRKYALAHYTEGWDIVVEAWENEDILREAGSATNPEAAIRNIAKVVKIMKDYEDDIRAEAF